MLLYYDICNDYYINLLEKYILLTRSYLPISHQFHQYQQKEQSPLILTEHKHKTLLMDPNLPLLINMMMEIQALPWDMYIHLAGLNLLMDSQPPPLHYWISNYNTYKTYWFTFIYLVISQLVKTSTLVR